MILYHGTDVKIEKIFLNRGRVNTDFGQGFYATDSISMAKRWALVTSYRRILVAKKHKEKYTGVPIVMQLSLNDSAFSTKELKVCRFLDVTKEWFDFVGMNRDKKYKSLRHDFDIVQGAIADDRIFNVVRRYENGEISLDQAIKEVKAYSNCFQVSFHTAKALEYLSIVKYFVLQGSSLKNNRWNGGSWVEKR